MEKNSLTQTELFYHFLSRIYFLLFRESYGSCSSWLVRVLVLTLPNDPKSVTVQVPFQEEWRSEFKHRTLQVWNEQENQGFLHFISRLKVKTTCILLSKWSRSSILESDTGVQLTHPWTARVPATRTQNCRYFQWRLWKWKINYLFHTNWSQRGQKKKKKMLLQCFSKAALAPFRTLFKVLGTVIKSGPGKC